MMDLRNWYVQENVGKITVFAGVSENQGFKKSGFHTVVNSQYPDWQINRSCQLLISNSAKSWKWMQKVEMIF